MFSLIRKMVGGHPTSVFIYQLYRVVTGSRRESKVPYEYCVESLKLDFSVVVLSIRLEIKRMRIDETR
tara:strand:+ start:25 stop:228 length:204 start_codon:yes stop_codon:yes gene_type:complete